MKEQLRLVKIRLREKGLFGVLKLFFLRLRYLLYVKPKILFKYYQELNKETKERIKCIDNYPRYEHGEYNPRPIKHSICRTIARIVYSINIFRNKKTKILVVLHFYYQNSADEIRQYLKNLSCYEYDLIITCVKGQYRQDALNKILSVKPNARIHILENRGYDIGPFIKILKDVDLDSYDIVIKLQTKSSDKSIFVYNQFFQNHDWFQNLWDGVLGDFSVHKTIDKLQKNKKYGIVAAKNLIIHDPKHKQELVKETLANYKKIKYVKDYYFVAGSCFAIKSECLKKIKSLDLKMNDFESTKYGFFSLAHVMERAVCFSISPNYVPYGNKVDFVRNRKWRKLEKKLKKESALAFVERSGYSFSPDFVWHSLEMIFVNDFEVEKIKLKNIKREYFDGNIIPLEKCEPYLYLSGDKKKYRDYEIYQEEHNLPHMTAKRFEKLIKSIEKNGYDKKYPIVIGKRKVVWDGQHRACILLKKYGPEHEIDVVRISAFNADYNTTKPFSDEITMKEIEY